MALMIKSSPMLIISKLSAMLGLMMLLSAAEARLLDDDEAKAADITALQSEAQLFSTIRMGIALSMAQCNGQEDCTPTVNSDEIKRLLDALNAHIDEMTLRQEDVENPDEYQQVLAKYTGERDNYNGFLEQLDTIESSIEEIGIAEEFDTIEDTGLEDVLTEETEILIEEEEEELTGLDEFLDESASGSDEIFEEEDFTDLDEFLDEDEDLDLPDDAFDATAF